MSNIFETLKTNELFKILEEERSKVFTNEKFYQELKNIRVLSKNWNTKKKAHFIALVVESFSGMDAWQYVDSDSTRNIIELAQSKEKYFDYLNIISESFPDLNVPQMQKLRYIVSEIKRVKERQKNPIYNLNQKPQVIFKDFGFKLAVINQLMFNDNKLKPRFNINLFVEEYPKYYIDVEWYQASPEAGEYLFNLDIPEYLLSNIYELELDKNAEIYRRVCHPWLLGSNRKFCYDGYFPIRDEAVEDLALLPNLKSIHLIGEDKFEWGNDNKSEYEVRSDDISQQFLQLLKEKGIKLEIGEIKLRNGIRAREVKLEDVENGDLLE